MCSSELKKERCSNTRRASTTVLRLVSRASATRREIREDLVKKGWFQRTNHKLQQELLSLPESHNGYLRDLASRPEKIANINVTKLVKLAHGNFAIVSVFEIRNCNSGRIATYEYVSWRHGSYTGAKGLLLVKDGERLTHFVVLEGEKFATALNETDLPGGFIESKDENTFDPMVARFTMELREEVGLQAVSMEGDPVDLGLVAVDPGMTNSRVRLFVATINASIASRIDTRHNNGSLELEMGAAIIPIKQLASYLEQSESAFLGQCVVRAVTRGLIPVEVLVPCDGDQ